MPRGSLVHRAPTLGRVLRHMRGDVHPAQFSDEFLSVVILVTSKVNSQLDKNMFSYAVQLRLVGAASRAAELRAFVSTSLLDGVRGTSQ